jgi:NAD(P)-dependent dehydrogenase (short-subunit alcohol dehydrogenase family)
VVDVTAETASRSVVVVTGGGSGIGAAACRALGAAGFRPLVTDIDARAAEQVAAETDSDWVRLDVTDPDSWAALRSGLRRDGTAVEGLVLNAGLAGGGTVDELDLDRYRSLFAVNVDGVTFGLAAFGRDLRARGAGFVVVTASMAGVTAVPFDPLYAMTKHAVVGLVRSIAAEYLQDGVRVQAVCPGMVDTPLLGAAKDQMGAVGYALLSPESIAGVLTECALGRRDDVVTVVQVGREPMGYRFAGVPGPGEGTTKLPAGLSIGRT